MSWTEKMKQFGGGDFTFLSMDGECITFIVVGDPVLLTTMFKGKEQERIGCPVVTDAGYQLFITGKRTARKISKYEGQFGSDALMVIRHGVEGDVNSSYEVKVVPEQETFDRLVKIRNEEFKESMIQESVDAVNNVLGR